MDLKSALSKLGRSILATIGLATVVQVGFEEPVLLEEAVGAAIVSTRLSGAVTDEMIPLVENSVPTNIVFSCELYTASGKRSSKVIVQSLFYRSLDRRFVVAKNGIETAHATIESAIADLELLELALPDEKPASIVFGARLDMPTIPDAQMIRDLWRGQIPTLVYSMESR